MSYFHIMGYTYLCQGGCVFVIVCLSVCYQLCTENFQTDLHISFVEGWQLASEQMIKFWWRSGSGIQILIRIATLVRRSLVEACTVPVLLVLICSCDRLSDGIFEFWRGKVCYPWLPCFQVCLLTELMDVMCSCHRERKVTRRRSLNSTDVSPKSVVFIILIVWDRVRLSEFFCWSLVDWIPYCMSM